MQVVDVTARLTFPEDVVAVFSDILLVARDCSICRRSQRMAFFELREEALCTGDGLLLPGQEPSLACHRFPGRLVSRSFRNEGAETVVVYRIEYPYEPFEDAAEPSGRKTSPRPTWGRIGFAIVCPACERGHEESTQNNLVRPRVYRCSCGKELFTEREEMPMFSLLGADFA
jgi:hypothetical protein